MTQFPSYPKFESAPSKDGVEMRRLKEDYLTVVKFPFGWSLEVLVKKGYETDGATVSLSRAVLSDEQNSGDIQRIVSKHFPGEKIEDVYNRIVGTPWDMPRLYAAVVHDALYSIKWMCRWLCDIVYRRILMQTDYDAVRREIEYSVIRLVGWKSWNAVKAQEREAAKPLVSVRWCRTKC